MLSELGKYGASFVLVTQSLSKLDAIDRNLAPTIFANSDGLTVFQVSAEDARKLTPELGGGIEVEDLVSLDDFTCYARWWDGRARPPAFSFRVDPPPRSSPGARAGDRAALRRPLRPPARRGRGGDHAHPLGALAGGGRGKPGAEVGSRVAGGERRRAAATKPSGKSRAAGKRAGGQGARARERSAAPARQDGGLEE